MPPKKEKVKRSVFCATEHTFGVVKNMGCSDMVEVFNSEYAYTTQDEEEVTAAFRNIFKRFLRDRCPSLTQKEVEQTADELVTTQTLDITDMGISYQDQDKDED